MLEHLLEIVCDRYFQVAQIGTFKLLLGDSLNIMNIDVRIEEP